MKKALLFGMAVVFLTGCGTLYIEGTSLFTGPIFNRDLTEKSATMLPWLAGKKVAVVRGENQYCSSSVVGHTLENWLGLRGAQPTVRKDTAEYEAVFYSDRDYSGHRGQVEVVRVRLRIIDRLGEIRATSKGESSHWEYQSDADEDELCEAAARGAVKNLR